MSLNKKLIDIFEKYSPGLKIRFLDIGASGGLDANITGLGSIVESYGFEPNKKEYEKLIKTGEVHWLPEAVAGTSGNRALYITKAIQNSSLLVPDKTVLNKYEWADGHDIVTKAEVQCRTLESICRDYSIGLDILKIDTQGTELEILKGAADYLDHAGFIFIEVEFQPIYTDQPVFRDVDNYLQEKGFELLDLGNLLRIKARGTTGSGNARSRLVSADAIYIKKLSPGIDYSRELLAARFFGLLAYGYQDRAAQSLEEDAFQVLGKACVDELKQVLSQHSSKQPARGLRRLLARVLNRMSRMVRPADASCWTDPWIK